MSGGVEGTLAGGQEGEDGTAMPSPAWILWTVPQGLMTSENSGPVECTGAHRDVPCSALHPKVFQPLLWASNGCSVSSFCDNIPVCTLHVLSSIRINKH